MSFDDFTGTEDVEVAAETDITTDIPVENPSSSRVLLRKASVSEAAEIASGGWNAPAFLSWFEKPFHIADPDTGKKLPEVAGQALDAAGRGPLTQVGGYMGVAIVLSAATDAGCAGPNNCSVFGIKPGSLLTATSTISGVLAALLMPVFGAIVDHTSHRKLVGVVSGFVAVIAVGVQMCISTETWLFVLIVDGIGGFALLVHAASVYAYLPDLTRDYGILSHYTSRINVRAFSVQFAYLAVVVLIGYIRDLDRSLASSQQTARDAASLALVIGALCFGYAWTFLFRKRPALTKVPKGATLLSTGFRQVATTSKKIWKDYVALKWFMISLLLSPEAGTGVVQSIATTFFVTTMEFTGLELAKSGLILLAANLPGSMFSKWFCTKFNPLNSYRAGLSMLGLCIAVSCAVFTGPERRGAVYWLSSVTGFAMGWTYPSQRVLLVSLIPKGQETEMMGLFTFMGQIIGWLPPLLYTILNENGVNQRWGLAIIPVFCISAVILTLPMGSYEDAVERVSQDSEAKLEAVIKANGGYPQKNKDDTQSEKHNVPSVE